MGRERPGKNSSPLLFLEAAFLPVLLFLILGIGFSATSLVTNAQQFARDTIGPFLEYMKFFNWGTGTAIGLLQFFAAFTMIYFVVTTTNQDISQLNAFMATIFFLGFVAFFVKLDWYNFLIHMAPATVVFLITLDILDFMAFISKRVAKWIALFSMILVFWTDYTYYEQGIFGHFFSRIFGNIYATIPGSTITIVIAIIFIILMRMSSLVIEVMKTETARQYQLAFEARAPEYRAGLARQLGLFKTAESEKEAGK